MCFQRYQNLQALTLLFNTTLPAKVISWWSVTHIPQFSLQSLPLLFSQSLAKSERQKCAGKRGENTPEREFCLNQVSNSQPPGHVPDTLTSEPLEGLKCEEKLYIKTEILNTMYYIKRR